MTDMTTITLDFPDTLAPGEHARVSIDFDTDYPTGAEIIIIRHDSARSATRYTPARPAGYKMLPVKTRLGARYGNVPDRYLAAVFATYAEAREAAQEYAENALNEARARWGYTTKT